MLQSDKPANAILKQVRQLSPDLLVIGWIGRSPRHGYSLGSTLDPVLNQTPCNVIVVRAEPEWPAVDLMDNQSLKILIPTSGGPNTLFAMDLALTASEQSEVTALYITRPFDDEARPAERSAGC